MKNSDRYRLDAGEYRIVYSIEPHEILVDLIEKRDSVYQRLRRL